MKTDISCHQKNSAFSATNAGNLSGLYQRIVSFLILFFVFLLPLKFGVLTGLPEVTSYFPEQAFAWLIISWPASLFPFLTGILLLLTLTAFPPRFVSLRNPVLVVTGLWVMLFFAALPGIVNAGVWDFVITELIHLSGIAAFAVTIYLLVDYDIKYRDKILVAVFLGTALTVLLGLQQLFFGFDNTREFIEQRQTLYGIDVGGDMMARVMDNRVFASFASCNSLAGYLLLTGPTCLILFWNWCGRIDPPKQSRALLVPLLAVSLIVVFLATKSRAAFLSLIVAGWCIISLLPVDRKLRLGAWSIGLLTIILGGLYIYFAGRGFLSATARLDYYRVSVTMLLDSPVTGAGWGDFFHDYMKLKNIATKEAPHTPHNLFLAFGSQAGILGLLAALAAFLYPLWRGVSRLRKEMSLGKKNWLSLDVGMLAGFLAFAIHSVLEVHLQVPALMATGAIIAIMLMLPSGDGDTLKRSNKRSKILVLVVAITLIAVSVGGGWHLFSSEIVFARLIELCDYRNKNPKDFMQISPEEVVSKLQTAVNARPYSPFPWITAGNFMFNRRYFVRAEDFYLRAIPLGPERAVPYHRLYIIQTLTGRPDEAAANLDKAREMFPLNPKYEEPLPSHILPRSNKSLPSSKFGPFRQ